jgi:hypothetical protein
MVSLMWETSYSHDRVSFIHTVTRCESICKEQRCTGKLHALVTCPAPAVASALVGAPTALHFDMPGPLPPVLVKMKMKRSSPAFESESRINAAGKYGFLVIRG